MKSRLPPRRSVLICDLDGTLIDSVPDLAAAVNALLAELDRPPLDEAAVARMVGDGVAKLVERALTAGGVSLAEDALPAHVACYMALYDATLMARTRPYPGVAETLSGLRAAGWRLAVCTNKPEAPTRAILEALDLAPLFEAVAGGDSYPVRKPDAGHLLGLLRAMDAAPDEAVMLGDGVNDVAVARAAGLPVIAVAHGYGTVPAHELGADVVLDRFAALPPALAELNGRW